MSLSALDPHRRAPHRVRVAPYLNTFLSQRLSPTPVGITGRHSHSITRTSAVPTHITASTSVCGKRRRSGTVSQTTRTTSGSEQLSLSVGCSLAEVSPATLLPCVSPCLPWEYDPRELDPSRPLKRHLRAEGPAKSSRYVYTWLRCVAVPPLLRCTEMSEIRTLAPCGPTACRRWPRFSTILVRFVHTGQLYQADRTLSVAKLCGRSLLVCSHTLALISECRRYMLVNTFDRGHFRRTAPCRFL